MSELDRDIRLNIEERIDDLLSGQFTELDGYSMLTKLGIEPNLESMLSFLIGTIYGIVMSQSKIKHGTPRDQDITGARELLSRRIMELRQYYLQTRYK